MFPTTAAAEQQRGRFIVSPATINSNIVHLNSAEMSA
jgi:hypothetical protein